MFNGSARSGTSIRALLFRQFRAWARRAASRKPRKERQRFIPTLECFEDRIAPAVLTVNSLVDSTSPGNYLTLRVAVEAVDGTLGRSLSTAEKAQISGTLGNNDTIQFSIPSGSQTITLTAGALDITNPLTISGPGAANLTINGNNADRVFIVGQIFSMNLSQTVAISGLTVSGGNQSYGGGLLNFGSLTVNNCTFSGNSAGSSGGGGIYNVGSLTLQNSSFSGNTVGQLGSGGGLENISSGTATISNCTFSSNTATGSGANASSGAAIANSGSMQLSNSTVSGNTAASDAGGIDNSGTLTMTACSVINNYSGGDGGGIEQDGTIMVIDSTLSGNTAFSTGGGINNNATVTISDSTLYGNTANTEGGGLASYGPATLINCTVTANRVNSGSGGGISSSVAPTLDNTIVAGNYQYASPSTTASDIAGNVNSASISNLIGTGGAGGLTNGSNGNQVGVSNAGLGTLASNGGATQTVALLPASPAIDKGSNSFVNTGATDQRGFARVINGTADIGAFEVQTVSTAPANQSGTQGTPSSFNLGSFADANSSAGPWSVSVNWGDNTSNTTFMATTIGALAAQPHSFISSGTITVTVTVSDTNHDSSQAAFQVAVSVATGPCVMTVNSLADSTAPGNALTLREAILLADGTLDRQLTPAEQEQITGAIGNNTTIQFALPAGPQTITLTGGALTIMAPLTINGPGASKLTINGNGADRVFVLGQIFTRNLSLVDAINGLTISGGAQTYGAGLVSFGTLSMSNCVISDNTAGNGGGGGIDNDGALTLNNCSITGNSVAPNTQGGGLVNPAGATASAINCTFSNNTAGGSGATGSEGGGAFNSGTITLAGCTFNANSAGSDGGGFYTDGTATAISCAFTNNYSGADGGALHTTGTFTIADCLVASNTASSEGGGLEEATGGNLAIFDTTFADNTAYTNGGALFNYNGASVTLTNDTITGNRVIVGSGGIYGAGIYAHEPVTLQNTIVAGNFSGTGATPNDIDGTVASGSSYNLIGTGGAGGLGNGSNHNQVGVASPGLGTLAGNGGPTQTVALLPGSPAINRGNNAFVANGDTDQRGFARVVNGTVDIGAFELQVNSTAPANQTGGQNVSQTYSLGSFSDARPSASPWTVTVNWGDGTADTTFQTSATGALPGQTHAFTQPGTLTVTVTVSDVNHDTSQQTFQVQVETATYNQPFDPGFELPHVGSGPGAYVYAPSGSPWTFQGNAGVSGNGSNFTGSNPNAPQGSQIAFLQDSGSISQTFTLSGGTFVVSFDAAQRGNANNGGQEIEVLVDGKVVGTITPQGTSYETYISPSFSISSPGSHTIELLGLDPHGGDNTAFVDQLALEPDQPTDPGFELPDVGSGSGAYTYAPSGSPWTFQGLAGVSGNGSNFTGSNPDAPQGSQVAFVQDSGSISQALHFDAGTYILTFDAAQRGNYNHGGQTIQVLVDGKVVGAVTPQGSSYTLYGTQLFTVAAGNHTIELLGLDPQSGDNTAFVDQVLVQAAIPNQPFDPGFELAGVGSGSGAYAYAPSGSPWTFQGNAGVSGNGSGFTGSNPNAPQGSQVAFLQDSGSLSQAVNLAGGTYTLTFDAAQRGNGNHGGQEIEVLVDGKAAGTITPQGSRYTLYSSQPFTVAAGNHTVELLGLDPQGGDNTAFVDQVLVQAATPNQPFDPGFEMPGVGSGAGAYVYNPSGSPWTFQGNAGVSGNGSNFTGSNPNAPQGNQVAFLQGSGSISQSFYINAGIYVLTLDAAQRANMSNGGQEIEVLVDGKEVGTITPQGTNYTLYSTSSFTVAAGSHTVELLGLNPNGGDNTAFVDNVALSAQ